MINKHVYFPGLNGVRFGAAFLVALDHLELFKNYFGFKTLLAPDYSSYIGNFGVTIFFVLSGYLITFLLLTEKKQSEIGIKNFYVRRILRIWPLYFFIVCVSFFIVPHINFLNVPGYTQQISNSFYSKLILYSFFLTNVADVYFPTIAFGNILWSVAVEEQFYLVWPLIIKGFKRVFTGFLVLLIIYVIIKLVVITNLLNIKRVLPNRTDILIDKTRISCMIIGSLGAWIIFKNKTSCLKFIYSKYTQIIFLIAFFTALFYPIQLPFFDLLRNELNSLIIVVNLINISSNPNSIVKLETPYLNFLGKISYGIYVYHLFAIVLCIRLFALFYPETRGLYYLWSTGLLVSVILLSILIAHISYKYFESGFLRKKIKYTTIPSGDMIPNK